MRTCLLASFHESVAFHPQLWIAFPFLLYSDLANAMFIVCFVLTFKWSFPLHPLSFFFLRAILVSTVDFLPVPMLWLQSLLHTVTDTFPTVLLEDIMSMVQEASTCLCPWFWITTPPHHGLGWCVGYFCFEMFASLSSHSTVQLMIKAFQPHFYTHRIQTPF